MTKQDKDKALLTRSIIHWNEELDKLKENKLYEIHIGVSSCALCLEYYNNRACKGCPIAKHTSRPMCKDTPYHEADMSVRNLLNENEVEKDAVYRNKAIAAFNAEISFLKGLLDEFSE